MAQMFSTMRIILAMLRIQYLTGQQFDEYFERVIRTSKLQRIGKHAVLLTSLASVKSKTAVLALGAHQVTYLEHCCRQHKDAQGIMTYSYHSANIGVLLESGPLSS